jgi:hypothetical protein
MMKRGFFYALLLVTLVACTTTSGPPAKSELDVTPAAGADQPHVYSRTIFSKTYHIDRKYRSMLGPSSLQKVTLLDQAEPELVWITGYEAVVVEPETPTQVSQEFMCHSNLDFNPRSYWDNFKSNASMSGRLFTLSQGQQHVVFPKGFGIPMLSTEELGLATQVLNLNLPNPDLQVRHKVTIHFVRDKELKEPMKPLFQAAVQGFKSLEGQPANYGVSKEESTPEEHGEGCSVGMPAVQGDNDKDRFGQKFTGHWVVKPGREENRTLVTNFLQLQFDTTIHYIAVHLHPFAESLELIDRTEGKSIFKAQVKAPQGKVGIEHIDHLESVEGIPIYKDHEYELVSVYNNTTDEDVDSMAVMYMYLLDQNFHKPDVAALEKAEKERHAKR